MLVLQKLLGSLTREEFFQDILGCGHIRRFFTGLGIRLTYSVQARPHQQRQYFLCHLQDLKNS